MAIISVSLPYGSDVPSLLEYVGDFGFSRDITFGSYDRRGADTMGADEGEGVAFRGTGMTYGDELGVTPTGGVVTSLDIDLNGQPVATIYGFSLSFPTIYNAFRDSPDAVFALLGDTFFFGSRGRDHIALGRGNDDLRLYEGNDVAAGGGGNDTIDGGTGNDKLIGGAGNDTYYVDVGADKVIDAAVVSQFELSADISPAPHRIRPKTAKPAKPFNAKAARSIRVSNPTVSFRIIQARP